MKQTPTYLLLEVKLGENLADYVTALREDERSWPYIARKLRQRTNDEVTFSDEALRQWFSDTERGDSASAA